MTIPPLSLGLSKGVERAKLIDSELFEFGQAHGHLCKSGAHTLVHALAGRLQAGPAGNLELTVPASLIKGVFDALDEPGAEFVVRNNRTESAIKVMTKEEVDKLGGINHITERGHSYHYTLGPIVELPASGEYDKLWAISIKSEDLEDIRKSYGLETSPQLGFFIPVGCKKKHVTKENNVSKLDNVLTQKAAADFNFSNMNQRLDPSILSGPNPAPPAPSQGTNQSWLPNQSFMPAGFKGIGRQFTQEATKPEVLGTSPFVMASPNAAMNMTSSLASMAKSPSMARAVGWATGNVPLNTPGGVLKGLYNFSTLQPIRKSYPMVGRAMTLGNVAGIAASSYEPVASGVKRLTGTANEIADASNRLANAPGEYLSQLAKRTADAGGSNLRGAYQYASNNQQILPNIREPIATVRFGEGQLPNAINNYLTDASKRTAEYAGKEFGHYLGNPQGFVENALRYHTPARAAITQAFKVFNDNTGAFNAAPPDYKALGAAHGLSFAYNTAKNTMTGNKNGPSLNVQYNPLFTKEVISKTPGIPARAVSPMLGLKNDNPLTRWADSMGTAMANKVVKQPFGERPTPVVPELNSYLKNFNVKGNTQSNVTKTPRYSSAPSYSNMGKRMGEL